MLKEGKSSCGGLKIDLIGIPSAKIRPSCPAYLIEVGGSNLDKKDLTSSGNFFFYFFLFVDFIFFIFYFLFFHFHFICFIYLLFYFIYLLFLLF